MMIKFYKYQSLGNDFILFDSVMPYSSEHWSTFIKKICCRHFGVGSDGVLVVYFNDAKQIYECQMFNPDGTYSEKCLNGLRCVARHLKTKQIVSDAFDILMDQERIHVEVHQEVIQLILNKVNYEHAQELEIQGTVFLGHVINVGNPHYVIQQPISKTTLMELGPSIETDPAFPNKTNVEFVWGAEDNNNIKAFEVLVFERGCGYTLACGSGAAAVTRTLRQQNQIIPNEHIHLRMPGGILETWVTDQDDIIQQAGASMIFEGKIPEETHCLS